MEAKNILNKALLEDKQWLTQDERRTVIKAMKQYANYKLKIASEKALVDCDDARRSEQSRRIIGYRDDVYTVDEESILKLQDNL